MSRKRGAIQSGRSKDGKTVSVTFWQDLFEDKGRVYKSTSHKSLDKWYGSKGHNDLISNLSHAWEHCDGELKIIVAIPIDPSATPREIRECFPADNITMRLTHLDVTRREFVAAQINPTKLKVGTDLQLRQPKKVKKLTKSNSVVHKP